MVEYGGRNWAGIIREKRRCLEQGLPSCTYETVSESLPLSEAMLWAQGCR